MKFKLVIISIFLSNIIYSQTEKDSLLQKDIIGLIEEIEFMYGYDQALREYCIFKTFDKCETDKIENLPDSLKNIEMNKRKFESDSIRKLIYEKYINPKDAEHTKRMIEITKKYGFPSVRRIKMFYKKDFIDPEFNPFLLFIHSPKEYWNELEKIMKIELENNRISQCHYGYLLWHTNGRTNIKYMLDNGYELIEKNGKSILKSTCE